jgi:hypothetical protein
MAALTICTAEFGVIAAKGLGNIDVLLSALADHRSSCHTRHCKGDV